MLEVIKRESVGSVTQLT